MSDSFPIRALAQKHGLPYGELLMVSDFLPHAQERHRREIRDCELMAYLDLVARLERARDFLEISSELDRIERKCHPSPLEAGEV